MTITKQPPGFRLFTLLLLALITSGFSVFAQPVKLQVNPALSQKYVLRESNATPQIQTTLKNLRADIVNNKRTFNVGFTGVSL
jgi:hypothetical protein